MESSQNSSIPSISSTTTDSLTNDKIRQTLSIFSQYPHLVSRYLSRNRRYYGEKCISESINDQTN